MIKKYIKYIKEELKFTIFDRYVLVEFIKPFIGALVLIVLMTNITELLERLNFFLNNNVKTSDIFLYYLYKSPYFIVQYAPVACLFAVVFSLGMLNKNKELIAMITQGVSFYRVVLYLYLLAFILSISFIIFNDVIVVKFQSKVTEMNRRFRGEGTIQQFDKSNLNMYGKNNYVYHIGYYHFLEKRMNDVQILNISPDKEKVKFRIDAQSSQWDQDKKVWKFTNGLIRYFDEEGNLASTEKFTEKEIQLPEKPKDFEYEQKDVEELTIGAAWEYIQRLKTQGFRYQTELVDFHLKFSFPFACLLMMLIGAPLSLYSTRSVVIISFGLSLLVTFVYWVILSIGISMGKNGVLPPMLAVWMGNLLFMVVSYYIHKKVTT